MKTQPSSKLYKYQPYNTQTLDNLKNRRIWFSKPSKFNDPFDCAIHFEVSLHTAEDWEVLYKKYADEVTEKEKFEAKYLTNGDVNKAFKDEAIIGLKKAFNERVEIMRNQRGVACFSEVVDNILMWAHYADGHRGFCLEFDTNDEAFSKAHPVLYSDLLPTLNLVSVLVKNSDDNLMDIVTTKASLWAYEKEWRLFHKEGDKEYGLSVNVLTGIYFGCEMPFVHKEIISLILAGSPTKLYEMQKVDGKFKVDFRAVEYTPYSYKDAKSGIR